MLRNKSYSFIIGLTLSFLLLFIGAATAKIKISYPPANVYVTTKQIMIVGIADEKINEIRLIIDNTNGSKSYTINSSNNSFKQLITLALGKNVLTLSAGSINKSQSIYFSTKQQAETPKDFIPYYLHSKNELTEKCDNCHSKAAKANYTYVEQKSSCITSSCHQSVEDKQFKHGPFAEGLCVECHNPHGTVNPNFLTGLRDKLCYQCHSEAEDMASTGKYVHFPITKGECISCHEPHQSNLEFHLKRDTMSELCAGCHPKGLLEHQYMHDPVESGDCNACHAPHISEVKGLVYLAGKDLCLTCHEVRKMEFESKYIHEPVAKDCGLCHDPHGSETAFHLRTLKDKNGKYLQFEKPLMESCLHCHRKLDPEVSQQIEHSKYGHKPVQEGKCTICHTPHSTNFKKQLKAPLKEICFSCHPKIKKTIESSLFAHGPVRSNDCGQCHLVHGSDHKNLLRANYTNKQTTKFNLKNFELCINCHSKKVYINKKTTDTGFRNGTLNLHYVHVNKKKRGRTCRTCHETHAANQEKHIRKELTVSKTITIKIEFTKTATGGGCVVGCHKPKEYDRDTPKSYKRKRR